ncbi:hypothetical protein ACT29H_04300 [Thermophagus sp. OGC60D27]|uniref:hypothetical protein n=1 Tax=Thermophagus sp. OGC60D27 TaxID=3458415 RepID=UPI004037BCD3
MFRNIYFYGLLVVNTLCLNAQTYDFPSPATSALGLSGASDTTVWSVFTNPSGISTIRRPVTGAGYHNAFGLNALSTQTIFSIFPFPLINVGLAYSRYGDNLFNIQYINVTTARSISPNLKLGCRFEYLMRQIQNDRTLGILVVDAGFRYHALRNTDIAISINNPARQSFSGDFNNQPIPSSLSAACITKISPSLLLTIDILHRSDYAEPVYSFALNARTHKMVELCGAISAKPIRIAVGANIGWNNIEFRFAANHHDQLGMSSTAGIIYSFTKKSHK